MRYKLEFLPVAEKDIRKAVMYISNDLAAPIAAAKLVKEIRKKANELRDMPYIYREYRGEPQTETIYRAMPVKNHIMFYTICEENKAIEIHRFLYARMNIETLLFDPTQFKGMLKNNNVQEQIELIRNEWERN